jgi:hypothetical protein
VTHDPNQTHSYNLTYRSDKESALTYDELDNNFRYFVEALQNSSGYVHPAGDGNLHVPATSTTNNGKVLTAGTTAGSLSWTTPASTYELTTASASVLGGIKIGTNLTISNGVLSSEDTNTTYSGTGLIIIDGSNVISTTANNYIHPTGSGHNHIPNGGAIGEVVTNTGGGTGTWAAVGGNFVPSDSSSTITGTLTATDFIINSDRRLKSNIKNLEIEVLHLLSEINPVTFNDGDIGFIAQDFEDRVPELVSSGDDGYLALKYSKITALLWKQNQELLKRIEVLENR